MKEKEIIMVVDDSLDSLKMMVEILQAEGYQVLPADSGELALTAIASQLPDLILLDIRMPGIDGFEVCRRLKGDGRTRYTPIIFLSAEADKEERTRVFSAGAVDFVAKPFQREELLARIKAHIELWHLRQHLENEVARQTQSLRNSEVHLRALVNTIPDLIWLKSADGVYLSCNSMFERFVGVKEADLLGKTDYDFFDKELADFFREHDCKAMEAGDSTINEEWVTFADNGHKALLETSKTPMRDPEGKLVGVLGIGHDITERKRTETYKEMSREVLQILNEPGKMQEILERVLPVLKMRTGFDAVGIRLQEGDDFPYFVQKGFSSDFLLKENSITERTADGGVCRDKDGNIRLECTCGLVISEKTDPSNPLFTRGGSFWTNDSFPLLDIPPDEDLRLSPRNECIHEKYASIALVPIRYKGRIAGLLQFNDRRTGCFTLNLIEILEGIASNIGATLLRKQVAVEKAMLEQQLHQAQKMESVGRLAGGVAHDFNNLLTVILGYTQLTLMNTDPGHPHHANLEGIFNAAERSAALTRQLLAFARKQTITPKVLDLNKVVAGILMMLQRLIGEDIKLYYHAATDLWQVKMDPSQIDQILANLCVNARDAIAGTGRITIETENRTHDKEYCAQHPESSPGDYVLLSVSDDGSGMDKETVEHIFEPFFTTKGIGVGTGLGLATVFGIIKQNNGYIDVQSEPGRGALFKIYIPALKNVHEEMPEEKQVAIGGTETILLVEDEKTIMLLGAAMLSMMRYTVLSANSPDEAIRLAAENQGRIDLLITDIIMPGMNGRDLSEKLLETNPGMKCLFMSGYTADVISERGRIDESMCFLQKPFTIQSLTGKVREALKSV